MTTSYSITGLPFSWLGLGGAVGAARCAAPFSWSGLAATGGGLLLFFGVSTSDDFSLSSRREPGLASFDDGAEAILSDASERSCFSERGPDFRSDVDFFITGRAGRLGMAGASFFLGKMASAADEEAGGAERGGRGGGFDGFEGIGTRTKSPVATGVISALVVGRPSLRKSDDDGTEGGGGRFLGS